MGHSSALHFPKCRDATCRMAVPVVQSLLSPLKYASQYLSTSLNCGSVIPHLPQVPVLSSAVPCNVCWIAKSRTFGSTVCRKQMPTRAQTSTPTAIPYPAGVAPCSTVLRYNPKTVYYNAWELNYLQGTAPSQFPPNSSIGISNAKQHCYYSATDWPSFSSTALSVPLHSLAHDHLQEQEANWTCNTTYNCYIT